MVRPASEKSLLLDTELAATAMQQAETQTNCESFSCDSILEVARTIRYIDIEPIRRY